LPPQLLLDPVRLRQILFNLLGNAVKFTERGEVRLLFSGVDEQAGNRARLRFSVVDTGIGMEEELLQRIFEPFTQGEEYYRRSFQGAGLGLSIVRRLVDLMRGEITVASRPGIGTTMSVAIEVGWLQGGAQKAEVATAGAVAVAPPTSRRLRVLLVEDSHINQMTLRLMVEQEGHQVAVAENGRVALQMLEQDKFDLVLMDVQMPEMDGLRATRLIRQESKGRWNPRIPVVVISAYAMVGDRERFLGSGADDYLAKPFMLSDLRAVLTRYGAHGKIN
jgi:two-component system sensor histidine kinase EvgS